MDIKETILLIKKDLRASMNGIASAAMRQSADYRVNFGVEIPRLNDMARGYEASHELAQTLWKENVRECRVLATILMPVDRFDRELCDIWVDDIHTIEIAQLFCMNLVRRLKFASEKAFEWIASGQEIRQCCGFLTLCHVLRMGQLSERSELEFLDQASAILDEGAARMRAEGSSKLSVLETQVLKALNIYGSLSKENADKAKKITDYLP